MAVHIKDTDQSKEDFEEGTLNDVVATDDGLKLGNKPILEFDGDNDYATHTDENIDLSKEFTVEFRVQYTGDDVKWSPFIGDRDSDGTSGALGTWIGDDGKWDIKNNGGLSREIDVNDYLDNDPHLYSITHDGSGNYVAYVDGNELATFSGDIASATSNDFQVGRDLNGNYGKGGLYELRYWNEERSQQQIQDNAYKLLDGDEDGLVAYYPLIEGSGNTLTDHVGNNDGTINGATWDIDDDRYITMGKRQNLQLNLSSAGETKSSLIEWNKNLADGDWFNSDLSRWTATDNAIISIEDGMLKLTNDKDGNDYTTEAIFDHILTLGRRITVNIYVDEAKNESGVICGGVYCRRAVSGWQYNFNITADNQPEWSTDWRFELYEDETMDFYAGDNLVQSGISVENGDVGVKHEGSDVTQYYDDLVITGDDNSSITDITIETRVSLDGGSTWTDWTEPTNGDNIPDLSQDTDVSDGLLECRQVLSTDDASVTPIMQSLTIEVNSQKLHEGMSVLSSTADPTFVQPEKYQSVQLSTDSSIAQTSLQLSKDTAINYEPAPQFIAVEMSMELSIFSSVLNLEQLLQGEEECHLSLAFIEQVTAMRTIEISLHTDVLHLLMGAWKKVTRSDEESADWTEHEPNDKIWSQLERKLTIWSRYGKL